MSGTLSNPNGAHVTITTYVSGRDENGIPQVLGNQDIESWRANAAVAQGEALMVVAPTATVPISVTPMTAVIASSHPWRFWGIAMEDAAAGEQVRVCAQGVCEVKFDAADTAAAYSVLQAPDTTTGRCAIATASADDVLAIGVVLGIESGTSDKCLAYVSRTGVGMPDEWAA